jgi:hypothetical protein
MLLTLPLITKAAVRTIPALITDHFLRRLADVPLLRR